MAIAGAKALGPGHRGGEGAVLLAGEAAHIFNFGERAHGRQASSVSSAWSALRADREDPISITLGECRMTNRAFLIAVIFCVVGEQANARKYCRDFPNYRAALEYYQERKAVGLPGWKSLDRDRDGRPCECLPGGNSVDKNTCGGERKSTKKR